MKNFRPFNPLEPVRIYRRSMPHWRQEGATYFVTFRQADSVPKVVLDEWKHQRLLWLETHGLEGSLSDDEWVEKYQRIGSVERRAFERAQAKLLHVELDRHHGSCVLRDAESANIVADAFRHFDGERFECGDFVVMPNHVHWLVRPFPGFELEEILQSVKRFTATRINAAQGKTGDALWQKESFDHLVRDEEELERTKVYIKDNPQKAKLSEGSYVWFSP